MTVAQYCQLHGHLLINMISGANKIAYASSNEISRYENDVHVISFPTINWADKDRGTWKIRNIDVYDFFGARSSLAIQAVDQVNFDGTNIIVPNFEFR